MPRVTLRHAVLAFVLIPSCFFLADMVNVYVSHALLQVTPPEPSTDQATASLLAQSPSPDATQQMVKTILSSGLFVVPANLSALDPESEATVPPPPSPIELTGKLKLLGTAIRDGGRPSAAIEYLQDHKQALYFLQDTIEGFGQLTAIAREGVTIRQGNRQGFLPFGEALPQRVPLATAGPTTGKPATPPAMIDRRQLNQNLSDVSKLMTEARAMPYYDLTNNGKLEGWQLIEIKPKSILDLLGIQQRDVLLRINGTPVIDPGTMLRLLQDIQYSGKLVKLDLIRGGERQTLAYEIR
jgi:type II secretory pathway component PulC